MSSRIRQSFLPGDYKSTTNKNLGGKMKKFVGFLLIAFFIATGTLFLMPTQSEAVPAFARQTGQACTSCHFQHIPMLNAFGREFKSGGYTMVGGQSLISGDMLSLPSVLNASLVLKIRYQKTSGADKTDGTNKGEIQFPDELALLIGGRVGENIGFLLEATPDFASFKMPFIFDVNGTKLGIIPFITDALGVAYSYELLNTGAQRNQRAYEHRKETSAQQYIGTADSVSGDVRGFAFTAQRDMFFANFAVYAVGATQNGTDAYGPLSKYLRVGVTPQVGDWDLGAGFQWWGGTTGVGGGADIRTHAWAIDGQAQGQIGKMPLGVYITYANAEKSKSGAPVNIFNSQTANNKTAFAIATELGVIPHHLVVGLAYRLGKNGKSTNNSDDAFTLSGIYEVAQNVELVLNHSIYSGSANDSRSTGKNLSTLMLEAAF